MQARGCARAPTARSVPAAHDGQASSKVFPEVPGQPAPGPGLGCCNQQQLQVRFQGMALGHTALSAQELGLFMSRKITDMRSLYCMLHRRYTPQDCPFPVSSKNDEVLMLRAAGVGATVAGLEVKKLLDAKVGLLWLCLKCHTKDPAKMCRLSCTFLAALALLGSYCMVIAKKREAVSHAFLW